MPTYLDGLHATLHALAWLAGALTPLLIVGGLGVVFWYVGGLFEDALTIQRARRSARRSGRYTGP